MAEADLNLVGETRRSVGRVSALEPSSVTIATPAGQSQQITTSGETAVLKATVGTLRDVRAGARIVVKDDLDSENDAALHFVVLPAMSRNGVTVVADTPDSITIRNLFGQLVSMDTAGARVDTTTSGTMSDITVGSTIFVRAKIVSAGDLSAEEIIVLPDGS